MAEVPQTPPWRFRRVYVPTQWLDDQRAAGLIAFPADLFEAIVDRMTDRGPLGSTPRLTVSQTALRLEGGRLVGGVELTLEQAAPPRSPDPRTASRATTTDPSAKNGGGATESDGTDPASETAPAIASDRPSPSDGVGENPLGENPLPEDGGPLTVERGQTNRAAGSQETPPPIRLAPVPLTPLLGWVGPPRRVAPWPPPQLGSAEPPARESGPSEAVPEPSLAEGLLTPPGSLIEMLGEQTPSRDMFGPDGAGRDDPSSPFYAFDDRQGMSLVGASLGRWHLPLAVLPGEPSASPSPTGPAVAAEPATTTRTRYTFAVPGTVQSTLWLHLPEDVVPQVEDALQIGRRAWPAPPPRTGETPVLDRGPSDPDDAERTQPGVVSDPPAEVSSGWTLWRFDRLPPAIWSVTLLFPVDPADHDAAALRSDSPAVARSIRPEGGLRPGGSGRPTVDWVHDHVVERNWIRTTTEATLAGLAPGDVTLTLTPDRADRLLIAFQDGQPIPCDDPSGDDDLAASESPRRGPRPLRLGPIRVAPDGTARVTFKRLASWSGPDLIPPTMRLADLRWRSERSALAIGPGLQLTYLDTDAAWPRPGAVTTVPGAGGPPATPSGTQPTTTWSLVHASAQPPALRIETLRGELRGTGILRVDLSRQEIAATCEVELTTTGVPRFDATFDLAPGWIIDDVMTSPSALLERYTVRPGLGSGQRLRVAFREPITTSQSLRLRIVARRAMSDSRAGVSMDQIRLIRVLADGPYDQRVAIRTARQAVSVSGDTDLERRDINFLSGWERAVVGDESPTLLFQDGPEATPVVLRLERQAAVYDGRIITTVEPTDDRFRIDWSLAIRPAGSDLTSVLIHFAPEAPPELAWTLPTGRVATIERQDAAPDAPGWLNSYRISFAEPITEPFELRASMTAATRRRVSVPLPSLPESTRQTGLVIVRSNADSALRVEADGPREIGRSQIFQGRRPLWQEEFTFEPSRSNTFVLAPVEGPRPDAVIHRARAVTVITPGSIRQTLRLLVENPGVDAITVMVPASWRHVGFRIQPLNATASSATTLAEMEAIGERVGDFDQADRSSQSDSEASDSDPDRIDGMTWRIRIPPLEPALVVTIDAEDTDVSALADRGVTPPRWQADAPVLGQDWQLWLAPTHQVRRVVSSGGDARVFPGFHATEAAGAGAWWPAGRWPFLGPAVSNRWESVSATIELDDVLDEEEAVNEDEPRRLDVAPTTTPRITGRSSFPSVSAPVSRSLAIRRVERLWAMLLRTSRPTESLGVGLAHGHPIDGSADPGVQPRHASAHWTWADLFWATRTARSHAGVVPRFGVDAASLPIEPFDRVPLSAGIRADQIASQLERHGLRLIEWQGQVLLVADAPDRDAFRPVRTVLNRFLGHFDTPPPPADAIGQPIDAMEWVERRLGPLAEGLPVPLEADGTVFDLGWTVFQTDRPSAVESVTLGPTETGRRIPTLVFLLTTVATLLVGLRGGRGIVLVGGLLGLTAALTPSAYADLILAALCGLGGATILLATRRLLANPLTWRRLLRSSSDDQSTHMAPRPSAVPQTGPPTEDAATPHHKTLNRPARSRQGFPITMRVSGSEGVLAPDGEIGREDDRSSGRSDRIAPPTSRPGRPSSDKPSEPSKSASSGSKGSTPPGPRMALWIGWGLLSLTGVLGGIGGSAAAQPTPSRTTDAREAAPPAPARSTERSPATGPVAPSGATTAETRVSPGESPPRDPAGPATRATGAPRPSPPLYPVVIPVDESKRPEGGYYFVPEPLSRRLSEARRLDQAAAWQLHHANHTIRFEPLDPFFGFLGPTIEMRLRVEIRDPATPVSLPISRRDIQQIEATGRLLSTEPTDHPSGEASPASESPSESDPPEQRLETLWATDGASLRLILPKTGLYDVTVRLLSGSVPVDGRRIARVGLLPHPSATLAVERDLARADVGDIRIEAGPLNLPIEPGLRLPLGPVSTIGVSWRPNPSALESQAAPGIPGRSTVAGSSPPTAPTPGLTNPVGEFEVLERVRVEIDRANAEIRLRSVTNSSGMPPSELALRVRGPWRVVASSATRATASEVTETDRQPDAAWLRLRQPDGALPADPWIVKLRADRITLPGPLPTPDVDVVGGRIASYQSAIEIASPLTLTRRNESSDAETADRTRVADFDTRWALSEIVHDEEPPTGLATLPRSDVLPSGALAGESPQIVVLDRLRDRSPLSVGLLPTEIRYPSVAHVYRFVEGTVQVEVAATLAPSARRFVWLRWAVDPMLRLERVTADEFGETRIVHWSSRDGRIDILLDRGDRPQETRPALVLRGHSGPAIAEPIRGRLPELRPLDGVLESAQLRLYRDEATVVKLGHPGLTTSAAGSNLSPSDRSGAVSVGPAPAAKTVASGAPETSEPRSIPADSHTSDGSASAGEGWSDDTVAPLDRFRRGWGRLAASIRWTAGTSRVSLGQTDPWEPLRLDVTHEPPRWDYRQILKLVRRDETWLVESQFDITAITRGRLGQVTLNLPAGMTEITSVTPPAELTQLTASTPDIRRVALRFQESIQKPTRIVVTARLAGPNQQVALEDLDLATHRATERLVMLPREFEPGRRCRWDTVGLQAAAPAHFLEAALTGQYDTYRVVGDRPRAELVAVEARDQWRWPILLADAKVRIDSAGVAIGTLALTVRSPGQAELPLTLPPGVELLAVSIDGVPVVPRRGPPRMLRIPLGPQSLPCRIEILFRAWPEAASGSGQGSAPSQSPPTPTPPQPATQVSERGIGTGDELTITLPTTPEFPWERTIWEITSDPGLIASTAILTPRSGPQDMTAARPEDRGAASPSPINSATSLGKNRDAQTTSLGPIRGQADQASALSHRAADTAFELARTASPSQLAAPRLVAVCDVLETAGPMVRNLSPSQQKTYLTPWMQRGDSLARQLRVTPSTPPGPDGTQDLLARWADLRRQLLVEPAASQATSAAASSLASSDPGLLGDAESDISTASPADLREATLTWDRPERLASDAVLLTPSGSPPRNSARLARLFPGSVPTVALTRVSVAGAPPDQSSRLAFSWTSALQGGAGLLLVALAWFWPTARRLLGPTSDATAPAIPRQPFGLSIRTRQGLRGAGWIMVVAAWMALFLSGPWLLAILGLVTVGAVVAWIRSSDRNLWWTTEPSIPLQGLGRSTTLALPLPAASSTPRGRSPRSQPPS